MEKNTERKGPGKYRATAASPGDPSLKSGEILRGPPAPGQDSSEEKKRDKRQGRKEKQPISFCAEFAPSGDISCHTIRFSPCVFENRIHH